LKIEEEKAKIREILNGIQKINEANQTLEKERKAQEREIEERKTTIEDKSNKVYELKKKTQELEKFKFVLDYKIKELKREIGPREEEIAKMNEQLSNMYAEVMHFKRTNDNLRLIVADLHLRQKGMQKEIESQALKVGENNAYIRSFETDLAKCYKERANDKELKDNVLNLYRKYVQNESKKFEGNVDKQKEFINQRAYLETCVKSLKDKFQKNMDIHQQV
jgi:chromosome segregation ATPase